MKPSILSALSGLALAGCSVVGIRSGTEEPHYTVAETLGALEIRSYGPRIAAETDVGANEIAARSAGFRRLAGYIFGGNAGNSSIAMTAPVAQQPSETIAMTAPVMQDQNATGGWTIRFFMPAQYTLATLPHPNDPAVHLVTVPAQTVAVVSLFRLDQPGGHGGGAARVCCACWRAAAGARTGSHSPGSTTRPGRCRSCGGTRRP